MRVNDFKFDYGILYKLPVTDYNITVGLTISQGAKIASKRDIFIRNMFKGFENHTESPIDTLLYIKDENVNIKIPGGFGLGVTIDKGEGWVLGADFNWNHWKGFTMNGANDSIQNSWNLAVGGSYKPESTSISKYYKKITYRAGLYFDQTYYNIYGKSINKFGLTLGAGLPIPRSLSTFNVALEVGRMGTIKNNLVKETYFNISVSMSIFDKWFIKKKYK
jgi:long-subunit fatty acid transport protein